MTLFQCMYATVCGVCASVRVSIKYVQQIGILISLYINTHNFTAWLKPTTKISVRNS